MITYTLPLSITPGSSPTRVNLSQYDSGFTLVFNLYSYEGSVSLGNGVTASVRGTKLDGNGYSASAAISGTTVTVTGDAQMTAIAGENFFEIVLLKNGLELSTANFVLDVERAALDKDTIPSSSSIREIVEIIDRTDEILDAVDDLESYSEQLRTSISESVARAELAANNAEDRLVEIQTYITNYLSGLLYGDEVSY